MKELKPCPFCGKEAKLIAHVQVSPNSTSRSDFYVECVNCQAQSNVTAYAETAIQLWNNRVSDSLKELIEEAVGIFRNCEVSNGYCCCGDEMSYHNPSNHVPKDIGEYCASSFLEKAKKLIGEKECTL